MERRKKLPEIIKFVVVVVLGFVLIIVSYILGIFLIPKLFQFLFF